MAEDFVWAIDENGKPTKCKAKPENRGKKNCKHKFHANKGDSVEKLIDDFNSRELSPTKLPENSGFKSIDSLKEVENSISEKQLKLCSSIAEKQHENQIDKNGKPYIMHQLV